MGKNDLTETERMQAAQRGRDLGLSVVQIERLIKAEEDRRAADK